MDFCTELSKGVVSKLGELGVESILKQFKYMIQHKKIIANLDKELETLKALKQSLQGWVDAESTKGNEIPPNMSNWLSNEAKIEAVLQRFYENEVNKNKKCFWGQCTDLTFNYSLGKQATKKVENITRLKDEGNKLPLISYRKAAPALGSTFTEDYKSLESRNKIIIGFIDKLKDDKLKRVGICGMGGVGKTTLVKELIKTVENKLFDKVVMAVVSQNPDYEKIQKQIADGLGLELKGQSVVGRGWEILQRLKEFEDKKVKVLIVLDDVWKELNFEWIGLSSQDHQNCIKILFTSRNEQVCQKNRSQENVHVSVLLEDEAWSLFREMAGDVVNKPDINPIAKEVAKECGGLPLAIATIARALDNEEKTAWEVALQQLRDSQSSSFSDMQECVYSRIELSFNFLGSVEHKSCLFLCGLFPEDFDIPIESLLRHGVGLGLFKAFDNIRKARNHIDYLVKSLKKCFLLLDSEQPACVKMHDVVRDVVLKIHFREDLGILVQSNTELNEVKQKQEKCLRLSLILNEEIELESDLECPTLELLQVQSQRKIRDVTLWSENFIRRMTKLKVLFIQNVCIPKIPSHFHASVNLHTLQLEGCDVGDISIIGREVMKLQTLSFANSNIEELPAEIGNLRFLKLLDLTGCDYLNFISANVFARLSRLEELYFRIKNFPWLLNKEFLKELRNLSPQLKVLEIKVRKVETLPNDLIFKNLEKFWVYLVSYTPYNRRGYLDSNVIQIRDLDYNSIKSSMMTMELVKKCEILILEKVKNLKNVISELDDSGLQCVKDLRLDSCPGLECVIDFNIPLVPNHHETTKAVIKFSNLKKLELNFLPKLIGFSKTPIHHGLSSTTKLIDSTSIEDQEILYRSYSDPAGHRPSSSINAKLFSFNWMEQFPELETLLLRDCISIEMIFDFEGYYSESSDNELNFFVFPQLRKLEIVQINNLLYVWGNVPCCFQGFHNLRFLTISHCGSLKYVFTSAIVRAIKNLEILDISYCEMIENIVVWSKDDKEDDNVPTIGFGKLYRLSLSRLPKLVNICSDSVELECQSLSEFKIIGCPMLAISLLSTHIHANQDNLNVTSSVNTEDGNLGSFKVNSSSSTSGHVGCTSFLPKFIRQRTTNKKINKEASMTQAPEDHIPSIFELKTKKVKMDMPALEEKINFVVSSHLKTITIEECDKLKTITVGREKREEMMNIFTQLQSLRLTWLRNLESFNLSGTYDSFDKQQDKDECVGDHTRIRCHPFMDEPLFPNLTSLLVSVCDKIRILFSRSSLDSLEHLEKLEVQICNNMQEIVSQEELEASSNKITLLRLKHLTLSHLPNLKAFCLSSYNLFFPSLQTVKINDCPNMEVFSRGFSNTPKLEDVSMATKSLYRNFIHTRDINATIRGFKAFVASQVSKMLNWTMLHNEGYFFQNSTINISSFHGLSFLVPFDEIKMLQQVTKLDVTNCDSLVEVFESGGCRREGDDTTQYQLQYMGLYNLPKLSHIWKTDITEIVIFQKLTEIHVSFCYNLKSLFSHSMTIGLVQLQNLVVSRCETMEVIINKEDEYIEGGNKVKTLFPKLKKMEFRFLPNLECVCSGNYDYDLPLCTIGEDNEINNNKIQISFPKLKELIILEVPKLKCFCSGVYDYNIMVSSTEECLNMGTFPRGNVIVNTPNLHEVNWNSYDVHTFGDLNLTIYYLQNSEKFMMELGKLETFSDINEELVNYIKRVKRLVIENNHKLLNFIPSNIMHLFSHMKDLFMENCECLETIFESNDGGMLHQLWSIHLSSLPKLKHIWKNHGQSLAFQNLTRMYIKQCHDLKYVFPNISIATSLPQLSIIDVSECEKMEEIIGNNFNPINCVQAQPQKAKIIFPSLWGIDLQKLPSLKCFCRSTFSSYVELRLGRMEIKECLEMKTFWYNGILYTPNNPTISMDNTIFFDVEDVNEVIQQYSKLQ